MNNDRVPENVELQSKWTKTTGKTFGETIRRSRNWSIKAYLVTDDDDGGGGVEDDDVN